MGRRKKCEQIKRTNNVMVRFTDAEYASIFISAEQAGYPVAVYVRKSALDERIEVHYNITAELPELQKLICHRQQPKSDCPILPLWRFLFQVNAGRDQPPSHCIMAASAGSNQIRGNLSWPC